MFLFSDPYDFGIDFEINFCEGLLYSTISLVCSILLCINIKGLYVL